MRPSRELSPPVPLDAGRVRGEVAVPCATCIFPAERSRGGRPRRRRGYLVATAKAPQVRGVVRAVASEGGRFWYDVAPSDHAAHVSLEASGAAVFRVTNPPKGARRYAGPSGTFFRRTACKTAATEIEREALRYRHHAQHLSKMRAELVGLRTRPRTAPPPDVVAAAKRWDLDDDEMSVDTRDSATLGSKKDDEAREKARATYAKWAEPKSCRGRWTHEASSVKGFLDLVEAEVLERERSRAFATQDGTAGDRRDDGGQRAIKKMLRKMLRDFLDDTGPPPPLDAMEAAPRFVAEQCALRGVAATAKLFLGYLAVDKPPGAAACAAQVARLAAAPGAPGVDVVEALVRHDVFLRAAADCLRGPYYDGAESSDEDSSGSDYDSEYDDEDAARPARSKAVARASDATESPRRRRNLPAERPRRGRGAAATRAPSEYPRRRRGPAPRNLRVPGRDPPRRNIRVAAPSEYPRRRRGPAPRIFRVPPSDHPRPRPRRRRDPPPRKTNASTSQVHGASPQRHRTPRGRGAPCVGRQVVALAAARVVAARI